MGREGEVQEGSLSDYLKCKYPPTLVTLLKLLAAGDWTLMDLAQEMGEKGGAGGDSGRKSGEEDLTVAAKEARTPMRVIARLEEELERFEGRGAAPVDESEPPG